MQARLLVIALAIGIALTPQASRAAAAVRLAQDTAQQPAGANAVPVDPGSPAAPVGNAATAPPLPDAATPPPAAPAQADLPPPPPDDGSAPPPAAAAPPEMVRLPVVAVPVNKWPEGLALTEASLWVAESGARSVAEIALPSRAVVSRHNVGRLPVGMLATASGRIFVSVNTDKKLWRLDGATPGGKAIAKIPDCPVDLTGNDEAVWILTTVDCSSAAGKLFRTAPEDGRMTLVATIGPGAFDLAEVGGAIVVVSTQGPDSSLTFVDKRSGEAHAVPAPQKRLFVVAGNGETVFAAGAAGVDDAQTGVVMAQDAAGHALEAATPSPVAALTAAGPFVIAVSDKGSIWIYDAATLTLLREIGTAFGPFRPQSIVADERLIAISTHQGVGDNGSVLLVAGWQPGAAPASP